MIVESGYASLSGVASAVFGETLRLLSRQSWRIMLSFLFVLFVLG